jgi:hypothetical protein
MPIDYDGGGSESMKVICPMKNLVASAEYFLPEIVGDPGGFLMEKSQTEFAIIDCSLKPEV